MLSEYQKPDWLPSKKRGCVFPRCDLRLIHIVTCYEGHILLLFTTAASAGFILLAFSIFAPESDGMKRVARAVNALAVLVLALLLKP